MITNSSIPVKQENIFRQEWIDSFVAEKILNLKAVDNYRLRKLAEDSYNINFPKLKQ